MYSLVDMVNYDNYPWSKSDSGQRIVNMKEAPDVVDKCCTGDAEPFKEVFGYINNLEYNEVPNYNKIKFLFEKILLSAGEVPSKKNLDWVKNTIEPSQD